MTKRKPTKHEDDVRRGLRTAQYNGIIDTQLKVIDELKAQVKRLTKTGDAVALDYAERIEIEAGETAKTLMKTVPVLRDWTAAKKGKQS